MYTFSAPKSQTYTFLFHWNKKKKKTCFFHSVLSEELNNFNYEYDQLTIKCPNTYNFEQYVYCCII